MPNASFPDQVKSSLTSICQLFSSCIQHYALHCSSDGHFAQLIFGADLARAYRPPSNDRSPAAITQLLINHFVAWEEQLGTNVKVLAFFLRDLALDETWRGMSIHERRLQLSNVYDKLQVLQYPAIAGKTIRHKEDIDVVALISCIFDTLPRALFDRKGSYEDLLGRLVQHNLDRIDDYLVYNQQLSFVTTGSSIEHSRLIDGILLPVHNTQKLLPSFISNSPVTIVFLNIHSNEFDKSASFSIIDSDQQFLSYDTLIYRRFVHDYLSDVQLLVSLSHINATFLFELHQANVNVIDSLDEQTFEFLLKVYQCVPCNRLLIAKDEVMDKVSTVLLDRHVLVNQQAYIYLSSKGLHQTLLTCVPTSTLVPTTQKILVNIVRLLKFVLRKLESTSLLSVATEDDYLKFVADNIPELRHVLDHRRIHLAKSLAVKDHRALPTCLFHEYLLNGTHFLYFINKIDGAYSTTRKTDRQKMLNEL